MPGVVAVLTHLNCPDQVYTTAGQGYPEPSPYDQRMFSKKVRHVGDRVAAVLAESPEEAQAALEAIEVEYEVLKPVLSIAQAQGPRRSRGPLGRGQLCRRRAARRGTSTAGTDATTR